jgi:hypothetical protein
VEEQKGVCALTGELIEEGQAVLDHDHSTQYVRGVLHRQTNVVLGKIENLWKRYLAWWYTGDLPTFLRKTADYLERDKDTRYYHPHWIKKAKTEFNKLKSTERQKVLNRMTKESNCTNDTERKALFAKLILTRQYGFDTIQSIMNDVKS